MVAIDLSERAQEQRQQGKKPAVIEAETAFILYRDKNGKVVLTSDLDTPIIKERDLPPEEMLMQMYIASESIKAQNIANMTVQSLMVQSAMAAQQMQAQQTAAGLGDLRAT